ncbi:MAG TPA: sugar phosphate nucleotidyltransferase [Candidatus Limnocylindria bacterium]|jgi:UTP--glucose-1-phosphate uridylyltransferase|nr:sugar phosphate nucleotidyltransferase [Candidatus Limnocylindria bacterium]
MKIAKAVITAAGPNQRTLPLQTLVDRDGVARTALAIIVSEALAAGVEEVAVVVSPGDEGAYARAAGIHADRLQFIAQPSPQGYAHAITCAKDFVGNSPFLLMVGDHVYVSALKTGCAKQLVDVAIAVDCAVSAVQATHESKLPYFGAVGGKRLPSRDGLYEVTEAVEKPTPTEAEQRLIVPGLRAGHYLCFFGMHILTPTVMPLLAESRSGGSAFAGALSKLARKERYLAYEVNGRRYDIGATYGLLSAQLALSLSGPAREEVLSMIVELLAARR